jgi:hypothetical protein
MRHRLRVVGRLFTLIAVCLLPLGSPGVSVAQPACVDYSDDPVGCQPSPFSVPFDRIPTTRLDRLGQTDPTASDADTMAGARRLESDLHLFRNFAHLHWVPLVPSTQDPATGNFAGGDLDDKGDARGLAIAGRCIFAGHENGVGFAHPINILRIPDDPVGQSPVQVGTIAAVMTGDRGFDDRELRASLYEDASGQDRMVLVRDATLVNDGRLISYDIDPDSCLPNSASTTYSFGGEFHEFYLWLDPSNPRRVRIGATTWGGAGAQDPNSPGNLVPNILILAITDENTGALLQSPKVLASFMLQDVGGPILMEKPDATGLFSDGRFPDFTRLADNFGVASPAETVERNVAHSLAWSDDGERMYVAFSQAGFVILNSEKLAHVTDAALVSGNAGCNTRSTNVWMAGQVGGQIDASRLPSVTNDCLHMVVNDDPGLRELLASSASDAVKSQTYLRLNDRSRLDPYPPVITFTGLHSAVPVPNRPSLAAGNTGGRPAWVVLTDENPFTNCPNTWMRIASVDVESTPTQASTFAVPTSDLETCLNEPTTQPNGDPRARWSEQSHNPTVFPDVAFVSWYGQGIRAIDISHPLLPREIGYAVPAPAGRARTYPVFKDGLMYWNDLSNGLHVARYTGPWASEIPGPGSGTYEGNSTSPHR